MSSDPVVITGISGRLPESDNIDEFKQNLMNGVDMVTTDDGRRWSGEYDFKNRSGKIKNLNHFDASFFGVHAKQAHAMDMQLRLLLEVTYEAIIDAGYNPQELKGSKTGVYVGCSQHETFHYWTQNPDDTLGYAITGGSKSMFANRISYSFDFKGPSLCMDTACSSGLTALYLATDAIQSGKCDMAIVAGTNITINPSVSLQFHYLTMLSPDGICRSFDESGNGYVRSEGIMAVVLQKKSSARRIYADVLGIKINSDGYKTQGITFPSTDMQVELINDVILEAQVDPIEVEYVEAHGTGTGVGDPVEMNAISGVYCGGRKVPLMVGTVKSNMGHAEPAAALCGVAKVIIAMESGIIPANLYYEKPNPNIPALVDGKLQVVTNNQKWNSGISAISSFGFGGSNAHALLSANPKLKPNFQNSSTPLLITLSGRTEEAVKHFFNKINELDYDPELHALIHQVHKINVDGHKYRGFQLQSDGNKMISEVHKVDNEKRPIWYVFTGMGCQWLGMGRDLLKLKPLRKSLECSAQILKPLGIDLMEILTGDKPTAQDNIIKAMVSIAATQIALVDFLKTLNIEPDGILGHSVGEIGCAYADNTLTHEQAVLLAYIRGTAIIETKLPEGLMASVGLSWEDFQKRAPSDIFAACHNSKNNITISGLPESITTFLAELSKEGIFTRAVNVYGRAFHTKYINDAAEHMRKAARDLIPNPKPRSKKWISSSVFEKDWGNALAKTSSADYHVNNLLSPVYFHEASQYIPENAIVVEIAPHALLQTILKRSLPKGVTNIGLLKRDQSDNMNFLFSNIGRLYISGGQPDISSLYPPVQFPVSRGTPMLGSMIKWDHSTDWIVPNFTDQKSKSGETVFEVDLSKDQYKYLRGHTIDGRILFPATGYLTIVWQSFAKLKNLNYTKFPVMFKNVKFLRATILPEKGPVRFLINIFEGTGEFRVHESGSAVASGEIFHMEDPASEFLITNQQTVNLENEINSTEFNLSDNPTEKQINITLKASDVYKELHLRGYNYEGDFKGVIESNTCGTSGILKWENNWVTFIDTMLQFTILGNHSRRLCVPSGILKLLIDPSRNANAEIPVRFNSSTNVVTSGGVEIRGLKASVAPRKPSARKPPMLEKYEFVPCMSKAIADVDTELIVVYQLVFENFVDVTKINVVGFNEDLLLKLKGIIEEEPVLHADCAVVKTNKEEVSGNGLQVKYLSDGAIENAHLFILDGDLNKNMLEYACASLKQGGFILIKEAQNFDYGLIKTNQLKVVYQLATFVLVRKIQTIHHDSTVIKISDKNYEWVELLKKSYNSATKKVYLVSEGVESSGLIGLLKCLAKEPGGDSIRVFFIKNAKAKFSLTSSFYADQLEKDLTQNVLSGETWGTFRHLPLEKSLEKRLTAHAYANNLSTGDLSSFEWIESELSMVSSEHKCDIYYAALNFRDAMLATGNLEPEALSVYSDERNHVLGFEFSGIKEETGKRVMGVLSSRGIATTVLHENLVWEVPKNWSLEEAATVPVVYSTCYYAMITKGQMKPGESILIHAGCGGVGLAAISIALNMGCKIYTTVGSQRKRDFLKKTFPELSDDCIGNSRDTSFEQMIHNHTNGRGVDLVLNSLAGEMLLASLRCLAINGRFLEIGKADMYADNAIGLSIFLKCVSFHGIIINNLCNVENDEMREIRRLLSEGIINGEVRPLPRIVFKENQLEDAFRYIASAKHIGKVVVKIRDEFTDRGKEKRVMAIAMSYFNPDKVFVIIGGLGGFGLELANWLISRGARKVVLSSRSGVKTGYQALCVQKWKSQNIRVVISTEDVSTEAGVKRLLQQSNALGVVDAIFNLAAVLSDALITNQTPESFERACKPKIDATKHLDKQSRILTPDLKYFVVFSSVTSGMGNAGQTNYGYANSAMERICENRKSAGLPALAIQWGAIGDVGLIAETMSGLTEVSGTLTQSISSCLSTLNQLLLQPNAVVSTRVLATKSNETLSTDEIKLTSVIANILGINNASEVSTSTTLGELGMDSLMTAEIKQYLQRNFDLVLSVNEIRHLTFAKLTQLENPKENRGLVPKSVCTKLQSKTNSGTPVFIIHHLLGTIDGLTDLAKEIEAPVFGIQGTLSAPTDSIKGLADYYINVIKDVQQDGPYFVIGYSFGAAVALEMGLELERSKEKIRVIFIDGTPEYLKRVALKNFVARVPSRNLHYDNVGISMYFVDQFFNCSKDVAKKLHDELMCLQSWDAKVAKVAEMMSSTTSYPCEDIKDALNLFQKRVYAIENYIPVGVLSSEVLLIKASKPIVETDKDYGISQYCRNFKIEEVNGNHATILTNPDINSFIKKFMSV